MDIHEPEILAFTEAGGNEAVNESDSAVGDDLSTYTASLTSSVLEFTWENGRRYHAYKSGAYAMPNDEMEMNRLDLTHGMLRHILNDKIHLSPVKSPQKILDVGTGTGIWAIEMGDLYPAAVVIGTDLSPTQPNLVPPNVKFEVDDCEEPWTFSHPFDFIYCRYLAGAIKDWPKLIHQIHTNTSPGGWVELHDYDFQYYSEDGSLTKDHALYKWDVDLVDGFERFGADPRPGPKLRDWATKAGFKNVKQERFKLPVGPWPKDKHQKILGAWNMLFVLDSLEAVTLAIYTKVLNWTPAEVQVLLAKVRQDLMDTKLHAQFDFYVVYGQKADEHTSSQPTALGNESV